MQYNVNREKNILFCPRFDHIRQDEKSNIIKLFPHNQNFNVDILQCVIIIRLFINSQIWVNYMKLCLAHLRLEWKSISISILFHGIIKRRLKLFATVNLIECIFLVIFMMLSCRQFYLYYIKCFWRYWFYSSDNFHCFGGFLWVIFFLQKVKSIFILYFKLPDFIWLSIIGCDDFRHCMDY